MRDKPLISIIVPVYNVEEYIKKCLESIINQTYEKLEILIINDGSTDNSLKICQEYEKKDKRIKVIDQKNKGVSSARNTGIENCNGEYISFIDPDDFIDKEMYQILIEDILNESCDIAVCGVRNLSENDYQILDKTVIKESIICNGKEFLKKLLNIKDMPTSVWNKIYKKDIIDKIRFDEQMQIGEDFKWLVQIILQKKKLRVYIENKILYNWLDRKSSVIHSDKHNRGWISLIEYHNELLKYVQRNIPELEIYEVKNALMTNISYLERISSEDERKRVKENISKLQNKYLLSKEINMTEKLKYIINNNCKDFYKKLKKLKNKIAELDLKHKVKKTKLFNIYYFIKFFIQNLKCRKLNCFYKKLDILDDEETISQIIKERKSFARFGDGEFLWMLQDKETPKFQKNSKELSEQLVKIIKSENKNLIIGIPLNLHYVKNATWVDKYFWRKFINKYGEDIKKYLSLSKVYGNTNLTRFYIGYKDKKITGERLKNLKQIWDNREILIVEGKMTKMGIGNDLFDNTLSIQRIVCPATNAFEKYKKIKYEIMKYSKDKLILIALGPTATILAYELSLEGYQAIDIGHIDIEYEWYRKKAEFKIPIEGKTVNEAKDEEKEKIEIDDARYEKQIVSMIGE